MLLVGVAAWVCPLTARYCGVRPVRPVKLPQADALFNCCICCANCCCSRRCSLSFCVSANFTTMGEEQPCEDRLKERRKGKVKKG